MKPKTCKVCDREFVPARQMQSVCSPVCASKLVRKARKTEQEEKKAARKADKAKREKLKTRSDWMKEAQREFNRYVRLRDCDKPCISCGAVLLPGGVGGGYDCGHFRSVGSAPHLRFSEGNAHGQCKRCNRYGSGMHSDYRIGLIARLGIMAVDQIEADQTDRKYTIDDLREIRDKYRKMANELAKSIENSN